MVSGAFLEHLFQKCLRRLGALCYKAATGDVVEEKTLVTELRKQYLLRKRANQNYSIRAFAKMLNLSPGSLSEIMSGKRRVGGRVGKKIADKLGLAFRTNSDSSIAKHRQLTLDEQDMIGAWYHMPLQDLLRTKNCPQEPAAMAKRLGISTVEAVDGLERLQRLGLCKKQGNTWHAVDLRVSTTADVPSGTLQSAFLQDLSHAAEALQSRAVNERDFSTVTMTFRKEDMERAKEMIRVFRRKFWQEFEQPHGQAEDVFQLSICFFPLTQDFNGQEGI